MEKTKFESKNVMTLAIRTESGRCQVQVDLDFLSPMERKALFAVVQQPQQGGSVGFGMQPSDDAQTVQIIFSLPNPLAPTVAAAVKEALN